MRQGVMEALRAQFLPEFLNRIDETIIFRPLGRDDIRRIVDLQLRKLHQQMEKQNLHLEVTDAARRALAAEGYDPTYGARPLKRVILRRLQNPLAAELLKGALPENGGVRIDHRDGDYLFERLGSEEVGKTVVETAGAS
jgi:ATP-dependent Clp protease ATP-binding subunit ClpB